MVAFVQWPPLNWDLPTVYTLDSIIVAYKGSSDLVCSKFPCLVNTVAGVKCGRCVTKITTSCNIHAPAIKVLLLIQGILSIAMLSQLSDTTWSGCSALLGLLYWSGKRANGNVSGRTISTRPSGWDAADNYARIYMQWTGFNARVKSQVNCCRLITTASAFSSSTSWTRERV